MSSTGSGSRAGAPRARERHRKLVEALDTAAREVEVAAQDDEIEGEPRIGDLRRRGPRRPVDPIGTLTLTEVDGVLQWREGAVATSGGRRRSPRRARGAALASGEVVTRYRFAKLPPNEIGAYLTGLDDRLTPKQGLRRLEGNSLKPAERPRAGARKRTLLFVHGTFSNNDNTLKELRKSPEGKAFLEAARDHYDEVLTFDHPTVAVSPMLNAYDLSQRFEGFPGDVDVVAHSRGGLVTRWWLEGFANGAGGGRRAVLVGSPLSGTSLAAPPRLRASLSLLTNFGNALAGVGGTAALALPFLSFPLALLKVVTSITSFAARVPLVDAAVALVPGLAAQQRVGNNAELLRLRAARADVRPEYFAVRSNFEPTDPGWKFWRRFRPMGLADAAADQVFDGWNDLVVDTASMTEIVDVEFDDRHLFDYGTSPDVHHVNYFRQPRTAEFLRARLIDGAR